MPENNRLTLRGGRVIDPAGGVDAVLDVHVDGGRIIGLGAAPDGSAGEVVDVRGAWVVPGLVDLAGQVGSPDALSRRELLAAAAGGITQLAVPPRADSGLDNPAVVGRLRDGAAALGLVRVAPIGALTAGLAGEQLAELGLLRRAGCRLVGQGGRAIGARVLRRAFEYASGHDLTVVVDAEDAELAAGGCVHEGAVGAQLGLTGIPVAAEVAALSQALALATTSDTRIHVHGVSSAAGVSGARRATSDPSIGVLEGLGVLATTLGIDRPRLLAATERIVHGTTVATNALLERKGAKVGLLTTEGHRDVLEMREGLKPEDRYNLRLAAPEPLVPRRLRFGVKERMRADGSVMTPLDTTSVERAVEDLASAGVTSVAICFLHAWKNAAHEVAAAEIVRKTTTERPPHATHWSTRTLAAELGTSSETLSRTLARLRTEKLIGVAGKTINVVDPARLAARLRRNLGEA